MSVEHDTHRHSHATYDLQRYDPANPDQPGQAHEAAEALIREHLAQIKAEAMEGLETNNEGIEIQRAHDFLEPLGLKVDADILLLDPEQFTEFYDRIQKSMGFTQHEGHGGYVPLLNVVVVKRDAALEERHGPEVTEYFLMHEMAHASTHIEVARYSTDEEGDGTDAQVTIARSGQVVTTPEAPNEPIGLYLEEGFADTIAQNYLHTELNKPNGFADDDTPTYRDEVEIPASYIIDGRVGPQAVAAVGVGVLIERDPTILDSLVKARNDPEGLQEVEEKIRAIGQDIERDELYDYLSKARTEWEFADKTRTMTEMVAPDRVAEWDERRDAIDAQENGYDDEEDDDEDYR